MRLYTKLDWQYDGNAGGGGAAIPGGSSGGPAAPWAIGGSGGCVGPEDGADDDGPGDGDGDDEEGWGMGCSAIEDSSQVRRVLLSANVKVTIWWGDAFSYTVHTSVEGIWCKRVEEPEGGYLMWNTYTGSVGHHKGPHTAPYSYFLYPSSFYTSTTIFACVSHLCSFSLSPVRLLYM